jgi:hypothetical protein
MDKRIEEIEKGLKELLKGNETSFIAKVETDKMDTVDVRDFNETLYPDVRKIATQGKKGVIPVLTKGSYVIVSRISKSDELFVSMVSEIDSLYINYNKEVIFNDGVNTTAKADVLKAELEKLSQRVDSIVTVLGTGTSATGGAVSFAGMSDPTYMNAMADKENFSQIENKTIKHG